MYYSDLGYNIYLDRLNPEEDKDDLGYDNLLDSNQEYFDFIGSGNIDDVIEDGSISVNKLDLNSLAGLQAWAHDLTFSATDSDTVEWTAGTITLADSKIYNIVTGNTGDMTVTTYIYLNPVISNSVLQISTTLSDAIGTNKLLICIATPELNIPSWAIKYDCSVFPQNASDPWARSVRGAGPSTEEINPAGVLHVVSNNAGDTVSFSNSMPTGYDGNTYYKVRAKLNAIGNANHFRFDVDGLSTTTGNILYLELYHTAGSATIGVKWGSNTSNILIFDCTDDYHVYEMIYNKTDDVYDFYIDGALMDTDAGSPSSGINRQINFIFSTIYSSKECDCSVDYINIGTTNDDYPGIGTHNASFVVFNLGDGLEKTDVGTATGQILYWDNVNSIWRHTEVGELFWNDTNKTLRLGNLYTAMSSEDVNDEASIVLPPLVSSAIGWGTVMAGDNTHWAIFTFTSTGVVTIEDSKGSVVNTDTDTNLCIIDNGTNIAIKNRIGSTQTIRYQITYS